MDTYDVVKKDQQWKIVKEGGERALRSFDRKRDAVSFAREYMHVHGGHLRIWSAAGDTLQEEHTYAPVQPEPATQTAHGAPEEVAARTGGLFSGIAQGAMDATVAAAQWLPMVGKTLAKGVYGGSYYAAYGVVFTAVTISRTIPMPAPMARGLHDGREAAIEVYEKGHPAVHKDAATT